MKSAYRKPRFGVVTLRHLPLTQMVERWIFIEALGSGSTWCVCMRSVGTY